MGKMVPGSKVNCVLPSSRSRLGRVANEVIPTNIVLPEGGAPVVQPVVAKVYGINSLGNFQGVAGVKGSALFVFSGASSILRWDMADRSAGPTQWAIPPSPTALGVSSWIPQDAAASKDNLYMWGLGWNGSVYDRVCLVSRPLAAAASSDLNDPQWVKLSLDPVDLTSLVKTGAGLPDGTIGQFWSQQPAVDSVTGTVWLKVAFSTFVDHQPVGVRWFLLRMQSPGNWVYVGETDSSDLQFALPNRSGLVTFDVAQTTMTIHGATSVTLPLPTLPTLTLPNGTYTTTGLRHMLHATMLGTGHYALVSIPSYSSADSTSPHLAGGPFSYNGWGVVDQQGVTLFSWVYRDGAWSQSSPLSASYLFSPLQFTQGKLADGRWAFLWKQDGGEVGAICAYDGEAVTTVITPGDPLPDGSGLREAKLDGVVIEPLSPTDIYSYELSSGYQTYYTPLVTSDGYSIISSWTHLGS